MFFPSHCRSLTLIELLVVIAIITANAADAPLPKRNDPFAGSKAGDQREIFGIPLCWCPPGKFIMGSPPDEPERRPGEDQVEVTLTKGFWTAKYETTQALWKKVMGKLLAEPT